MPLIKKPETFTTSDGRDFEKKADAEKHEKMLIATREFEESRKRFLLALAETQQTADGHLFAFGRTHWAIHPAYGGDLPRLMEVDLYFYTVHMAQHEDGIVEICPDPDNEHKRGLRYKVSELYADRRKAELALIDEQEKRVAEYQYRIEMLKQQVKRNR